MDKATVIFEAWLLCFDIFCLAQGTLWNFTKYQCILELPCIVNQIFHPFISITLFCFPLSSPNSQNSSALLHGLEEFFIANIFNTRFFVWALRLFLYFAFVCNGMKLLTFLCLLDPPMSGAS